MRSPSGTLVACLLTACLVACTHEPPMRPDSGPSDAGLEPDSGAGLDAGSDGGPPEVDDAGPPLADAGPVDPCATCVTTEPCRVAECIEGVCVIDWASEGASCDESGALVCVRGQRAARTGCGDGFREPGPEPTREACDDGTDGAEDACSSECATRAFAVALAGEGKHLTSDAAPAIGLDSRGRALIVWTTLLGAETFVEARRYAPSGAPLDETPIRIAGPFVGSHAPRPTVAGARQGWVVAWNAPATAERGATVLGRRVELDGSVVQPPRALPPSDAMERAQSDVQLVSLAGRLVALWVDSAGSAHSVRARRLRESGMPYGSERIVRMAPTDIARPVAGGHGEALLVAWTEAGGVGEPASVRANALSLMDWMMLRSSPWVIDVDASAPSVAPLGRGTFAIAWVSRASDVYGGDVMLGELDLIEGMRSNAPLADDGRRAEQSPNLVPTHDGGVAALIHVSTGAALVLRDAELTADEGSLGPEAELLRAELRDAGTQTRVSGSPAGDALWFAWTDDSLAAGRRSVVAFRLARP